MMLFTLLVVLALDRLFKLGDHWQIDYLLASVFRRVAHPSLLKTLVMLIGWLLLIALGFSVLKNLLFGLPLLLMWIVVGSLCIGAGIKRSYYRCYLQAAAKGDQGETERQAEQLALMHGLPLTHDHELRLRGLQNALLWINFRYYLAPIFWCVIGGVYGILTLAGYAFLRGWHSWLQKNSTTTTRAQSGVETLMHCLDWIPVRLAGLAYALVGKGENALPAWFASLFDRHTPSYQVLSCLAQYSLAHTPHLDVIATPKAATALAHKVTLFVVVIVALLTIYGAII